MKQAAFHNTISLSGDALKDAVAKAAKQEDAILAIYLHTRRPFTASQITALTEKAGHRWPLWSNRRAITNLMNAKHLVKTSEQRMGPQGRPEYMYQINIRTYPTETGVKQQGLF